MFINPAEATEREKGAVSSTKCEYEAEWPHKTRIRIYGFRGGREGKCGIRGAGGRGGLGWLTAKDIRAPKRHQSRIRGAHI